MEDNVLNGIAKYLEKKKKAWKKKVRKSIISFLASAAPVILTVIIVVVLGSGVAAALSAFAAFAKGLFGTTSQLAAEQREAIANMSLDEVLELVVNDKIDDSFYEMMMINREEFQYLLEGVKAHNGKVATRTIEFEVKHKYMEKVKDSSPPVGPGEEAPPDTYHYEPREESNWFGITVSSKEIENYELKWQLVYALCLTDTMNGVGGWKRLKPTTPEEAAPPPGMDYDPTHNPGNTAGGGVSTYNPIVHHGTSHEKIDAVIDAVGMKYEYITDLARESQTQYSYEECEDMVHTHYEEGDPDTESGQFLYNIPHSVLKRAYGGYSCMYYLSNEDGSKLEKLITAADVNHFELIMEEYCPKYNLGFFSELIGFIPGGEAIGRQLGMAYDHREDGLDFRVTNLYDYMVGSGINKDELPTSTEHLGTDFGDLTDYGNLDYSNIEFDDTIGGLIAKEALTKVGCEYDQARRWQEGVYDCSSLVYRVLAAVGIDVVSLFKGSSTAALECMAMVNGGRKIDPADIRQGDIVFYAGDKAPIPQNVTHVVIYVGDGKIVHAKGKAYGVVYSNYYTKGQVAVCRPY